MRRTKPGFTLIELIIVVVIIGILALVAIPRYFANIEKARRGEALSTLHSIREGIMAYYAAYNAYVGDTTNIAVVIDNEPVLTLNVPASPNFTYTWTNTLITAASRVGGTTYNMNVGTGAVTTS